MNARTLVVSGAVFAALSVALGLLVFFSNISTLDSRLFLQVNGLVLPGWLSELLVLSSLYGREYFWVIVVAVMLIAGDKRTKLLALELSIVFIIGIVVGDLLKALVYRPRPPLLLQGVVERVALDPDSSFPSGHALIVAAGAGFSILRFSKKWVAALLTLEASVVCFSRVFVGVHYPTDVIAGVLIGLSVLFFGLAFAEGPARSHVEKLAERVTSLLGSGRIHT